MSFTEKQKAYHLRKMKTRLLRMDMNKDGYLSREDYELMSQRLAERVGMTKERAEASFELFMKIADGLNLKPGVRIPIEDSAKQISEGLISITPEDLKISGYSPHNMLFDNIDTNQDGYISANVIAPEISEADTLK